MSGGGTLILVTSTPASRTASVAPRRAARLVAFGLALLSSFAWAKGNHTADNWRHLWSVGNTGAALAVGEKVVAAADTPTQAVALRGELAVQYSALGNTGRAHQLIDEAAEATRLWRFRFLNDGGKLGYSRRHAETVLARARCHVALTERRLDAAVALCEEALARSRRQAELVSYGPNPSHAATLQIDTLLDLARLQRAQGRLASARQLVEQAGQLADEHRVPPTTAAYRLRMAAYFAMEAQDPARAEALARQAVQLWLDAAAQPGAAALLQARVQLHQVLVASRDWPAATEELDSLEAVMQGLVGTRVRLNLLAQALTYAHAGRLARLERRLGQAADVWSGRLGATHPLTATLRGLQGAAALDGAAGDNANARGRRELAQAATALLEAQRIGDPYLAGVMEAQGARYVLERFLRAQQNGVPGPGELQMAFQVADVLRGSRVQAALQDAALRTAGSSGPLAALVQRELELRREQRTLEDQLSQAAEEDTQVRSDRLATLQLERQRLSERISTEFPAFSALLNPRAPTPEDVVRRLAVGELFVLLLPVEDGVHVWSLSWTEQGHRFVPMSAAQLAQAVAAIRASTDLSERLRPYAVEPARWLAERLLGPLQATIRQSRHLVVAAGGALGSVPFAALPLGAAGDDGEPWLIRRMAVSQVPSASAWLAIQRLSLAERPSGALLGWGDPAFAFDPRSVAAGPGAGGNGATRRLVAVRQVALDAANLPRYSDLPALPETRDELLAIAGSVKADPGRDLVLGAQATRASVLAANASGQLAQRKVVAFATHGLMAGDLPDLNQPALALAATPDAEANPLAPLLTLDDVLGLRLNADWVVLSACNTAAADGRAEEALSGLARGFFYAGARSVLVTHWAVETDSAKLLTTRTFEHYTANPFAGKAESLRQAMLSVMAMPKYQHPAFWAPYALVGDGAR